jgi:hypothetical protein
VTCVESSACTPTNVCHVGTLSCSGGPSCTDTGGFVADGTNCGTDQVCSAGDCVTCAEGAACTVECQTGTQSCATGPTCTPDGGTAPDDTPCTGGVCTGGVCLPP